MKLCCRALISLKYLCNSTLLHHINKRILTNNCIVFESHVLMLFGSKKNIQAKCWNVKDDKSNLILKSIARATKSLCFVSNIINSNSFINNYSFQRRFNFILLALKNIYRYIKKEEKYKYVWVPYSKYTIHKLRDGRVFFLNIKCQINVFSYYDIP